jgi:hypothetical protein
MTPLHRCLFVRTANCFEYFAFEAGNKKTFYRKFYHHEAILSGDLEVEATRFNTPRFLHLD